MHLAHLRAADPVSAHPGLINQSPGAMALRILKRRSSGFFLDRLDSLAMLLHSAHIGPDLIFALQVSFKYCPGEYQIRRSGGIPMMQNWQPYAGEG